MNQKKNLSWTGRFAKYHLSKQYGTYHTTKTMATVMLVVSLLSLSVGLLFKESSNIYTGVGLFVVSIALYQRAGFIELIEKEYTKKNLEPDNREVRETPAEKLTE